MAYVIISTAIKPITAKWFYDADNTASLTFSAMNSWVSEQVGFVKYFSFLQDSTTFIRIWVFDNHINGMAFKHALLANKDYSAILIHYAANKIILNWQEIS